MNTGRPASERRRSSASSQYESTETEMQRQQAFRTEPSSDSHVQLGFNAALRPIDAVSNAMTLATPRVLSAAMQLATSCHSSFASPVPCRSRIVVPPPRTWLYVRSSQCPFTLRLTTQSDPSESPRCQAPSAFRAVEGRVPRVKVEFGRLPTFGSCACAHATSTPAVKSEATSASCDTLSVSSRERLLISG